VALVNELNHKSARDVYQQSLSQFPRNGDIMADPVRAQSKNAVEKAKSRQRTSPKWTNNTVSALMQIKEEQDQKLTEKKKAREKFGSLLDKFRRASKH
jgi:hypothetical protein